MSEQFGLVFLVLFVLAAAACIYLSITMSRRVQRGINRWRDEEMQSLETQSRDLANADVRIQIERWKQQHEQEIRLDAIQRSSAVTRGKVTEHIVPYLPGFDLASLGAVFWMCAWGTRRGRCVNGWRLAARVAAQGSDGIQQLHTVSKRRDAKLLQVLARQARDNRLVYVILAEDRLPATKPYVKRQKNDAADAEAICEAVTRTNMRFVPIKTPEQQSGLMLHRTRHLFIRQQTSVINAIRAHLAEFGATAAVGRKGIEELLRVIADPSDKGVPDVVRACLAALGSQLLNLKKQILDFDRMIMAWHRSNQTSKRLNCIGWCCRRPDRGPPERAPSVSL